MFPGVFAGERLASVPPPVWDTRFMETSVIAVGVIVGLIVLARALKHRGRRRIGGLLVAVGLGVALPFAAWVALGARTYGGMVGGWTVSCEAPFVTSKSYPTPAGETVGWDDWVEVCRRKGASKAHAAEALAAGAVVLISSGIWLEISAGSSDRAGKESEAEPGLDHVP